MKHWKLEVARHHATETLLEDCLEDALSTANGGYEYGHCYPYRIIDPSGAVVCTFQSGKWTVLDGGYFSARSLAMLEDTEVS